MEITYVADEALANDFAHDLIDGIRFEQLGDIWLVHIQEEIFVLVRIIFFTELGLDENNALTSEELQKCIDDYNKRGK
jgi:hypothetical protein